jgi:cobalamin biosynthetic protein CobC
VLEHGGRLRAAAGVCGFRQIPLADWLDLSTGINPQAYPVPAIDPACWQRLPEDNDGLDSGGAAYYGNDRCSRCRDRRRRSSWLPALFPPVVVACLTPIYEEHPQAWERAGHKLRRLQNVPCARAGRGDADHRAVQSQQPDRRGVCPRRPARCGRATAAAGRLADRRRGVWRPRARELCGPWPVARAPNLIVLRSLGKFFGLAGARVGFVFGAPTNSNDCAR